MNGRAGPFRRAIVIVCDGLGVGAAPDAAQLEDGGSLDSLNAFQFAYQEQTHVDYSSSRVRATA